jgi:protein TonB
MRKAAALRTAVFLFAAGIHAALLFFLAFSLESQAPPPEPELPVMKLTDIREAVPPPPAPAAPPEKPPADPPPAGIVESIAETMVETDEVPPPSDPVPAFQPQPRRPEAEEYLPMHHVSVPPVFSEDEIIRALDYPPIARRSGVEGLVYLELFIDRRGSVRQVIILKEEPSGRGFGEAAVKAFSGLRAVPAQANGSPVAVRYRYPVRFRLRG